MDPSGRKNKLEELLARVRERGSGLHRAVGPAGESAELEAARSGLVPQVEAASRAPYGARRSSPGFALDVGSIGPGPLIEDEELEQIASRRSLDRYVEATLGDDEPSVPFTEEGEGWEPEALELERSDEAPAVAEAPERAEPRPTQEAPATTAAEEADFELVHELGREPQTFDAGAAPQLRKRSSYTELPPLPFSPFPSDRPPRLAEPTEPAEPADPFGDLDTTGPQALPLDVPWETLAKQLRGRRRSGEFRIDEASAPATSAAAQPASATIEPAAHARAEAERGEVPPSAAEHEEQAEREQPAHTEAAGAQSEGATASEEARDGEPPASRPRSIEPGAVESASPPPLASEPPDAIAGEPSFLRSARRTRRARRSRSSTWLPLAGIAVLGLLALWWTRSDGRSRTPTRATASAEPELGRNAPSAEPSHEARRVSPSESTAASAQAALVSASPPTVAATTVAPQGSAGPATNGSAEAAPSGDTSDTPPNEPLGEAEGWLRVRGRRFSVYLNGGLAGATGQWIRTACGVRHLRLAHVDPPPRGRSFPWWVDDGGPVVVPCGASVTVEVDPGGRR